MLARFMRVGLPECHRIQRCALNIHTYPKSSEEQITITDDGNVVVCWHPEKSFPYEYSKSLPAPEQKSDSIYKLETKEDIYKVFTKEKPEFMREELSKLTFTTKHRWFPRTGYKKRKTTMMNRPYL